MAHEASEGCGGDGISDVDCEGAVRQLYSFLDGELTDDRRAQIRQHLDACGSCAGAAEFEAELRMIISSRCREKVPDALVQRVAAALAAEDARLRAGS